MRPLMTLVALALVAGCNRPSVDDLPSVNKVLEVLAAPTDMRAPLLYQGCSEVKSCAEGCAQSLHMCADASTDSAMCATLLAHCSSDYRQRRQAGEKLEAAQWIEQHWHSYLDDLAKVVPDAGRASFAAARAKAKL